MNVRTLLGVLALAVLPAFAGLPAPPDREEARVRPLLARLEALDFYGSHESLNLRFSLTNRSRESVWILRHQVPSEDMDAPLFQVSRDGEHVPYVGPLVKRARPEASDYLEIKGGATYTAVFDPSAHYDMTLQGEYEVRFLNRSFAVRHAAPEAIDPSLATSQMFSREAALARPADTLPQGTTQADSGRATVRFAFAGVPGGSRQAVLESFISGYSKCTTAQQGTLQTAHNTAVTGTAKAVAFFNASFDATYYTRWFGTSTSANVAKVKDHFVKANDAFVNKAVTYDCGCKKSYYAYVYANQPYKIYLCKVFWTAPMTGRDSKFGTLIHEMMHFTAVAGTSDYVYGESGALNLARTNPAQATMNSDNHEYFAEDLY